MSTAYIGIGSNLGKRRENCLRAIELIKKKDILVIKKSSLYETEPWGVKDQPPFLNMSIEVETDLNPLELFSVLKDIERQQGREESVRWGPRVIDLDILLYDDIVMKEERLTIPHPLLHERGFVLIPLNEIAPNVMHPLLRLNVHELLHRLQPADNRKRY
jgi:dihydroneopterin aldolase / 2-amino-4-hydroxy-6-hydroxymethyldihydropteridine diphosphokinase